MTVKLLNFDVDVEFTMVGVTGIKIYKEWIFITDDKEHTNRFDPMVIRITEVIS